MVSSQLRRWLFGLLALLMIVAGIGLAGRAILQLSSDSDITSAALDQMPLPAPTQSPELETAASTPTQTDGATPLPSPTLAATLTPTPTLSPTPTAIPVTIALAAAMPESLFSSAAEINQREGEVFTMTQGLSDTTLLDWNAIGGTPFFTQTFVAATRFDTIDPVIGWDALQKMWRGEALTFTSVAILSDTLPALQQRLGAPSELLETHDTITDLVSSAWDDRTTLVLLPFDQLQPRLATLAIDGQNPLENESHFDVSRYPFNSTLYLHEASDSLSNAEVQRIESLLAQLPRTNRDAAKLTVVAMTGVTAMARMMGGQMDELGSLWPAEVISGELASADLTVFSNEVAFSPDCETNADPDVLLFCSKPEYWQTLESSGADLISLTGNHINDWGRESLSWTLDFYAQKGVIVYGGGANSEEANMPRIVEHNGNRLAFLGSNSVGPYNAWASDSLPGAARFDFGQAHLMIDQARDEEQADVIFYDMQYLESYNSWPLGDQRDSFNTLLRYGADVVTGMQSHVPQSMEFTDGKLILYGLGNLYFDQMWGETTRQSLIVKHTIYHGQHIGTQILVTILYDYGQPRWATAEERNEILHRLFVASYW